MRIILYIMLFLMVSCDTSYKVNNSNTLFGSQELPKKEIVYLFFEVEKQDNANINVKLVDKKVTKGFIKNENIDITKPNNAFYKIQLLDSKLIAVKTFFIDDPLNPILESYSSEGMAKEKANFKKSEFSVRYNNTSDIISITIDRVHNNQTENILTQILPI